MKSLLRLIIRPFQLIIRYAATSRAWRKWVNAQTVMVVGISSVFLFSLAITAPYSGKETAVPAHISSLSSVAGVNVVRMQREMMQQETPLPEGEPQVEPTVTRTPLPPEYLQNSNQTIGITLAAAVLVMIVVFGVLMFMPKREEN